MSDLISRQAAIEAMKCINDSICEQQAVDAIFDLPTAEKVVKWVPVSERLPEKNSEYLVTKIDHITHERLTDIAYFGSFIDKNNGFHKADDIVAWIPLPEPWKGEEDE